MAETVHETSKTARSVAKMLGDLDGGAMFDKIGAKGLILALSGTGGFKEESRWMYYLLFWISMHSSTVSTNEASCQQKNIFSCTYRK